MARLLVIDDEPNLQYSLVKSLSSETLEVATAGTARQGIDAVRRQNPDVVILDVRLPDMTGLEAFDEIRRIDPRLPVIIITAFSTADTAIEAMKRGAFEYLLKPVDFHQLRELVDKAIELSRLRHVPAVFAEDELPNDDRVDRIVGHTPEMQEVYKAIGRVASLDVPVLLQGESGTGKELVARAIYQHSRRSQGPFLAVNCAAMPEGLLESELFGHEKGSFTGADRRRIGIFEQADKGTLFLDEIGDMNLATQPKLLRLLAEQRFERVGGEETIRTDVRVIAATNQDLERKVAAGEFRSDLLYRLKVYTIDLPPLRNRKDDLSLLVSHFLKVLNRDFHKRVTSIAPEALRVLQAHSWPGNVRELQSAIKHAYVQSSGEVITLECLPPYLREESRESSVVKSGRVDSVAENLRVEEMIGELIRRGESDIYAKVTSAVDRVVLQTVLRHVKGNQMQAAEMLGISRTTLRAKMRSLGLAIEKQLHSENESAD
ncbi:MAG TPA: sigma-54 dependent transcriptional regulator [Planctomycetaceae bacterium]|nr:sigma-54 dependent transcriptional regulator [Planctomycetaceae bacterium]